MNTKLERAFAIVQESCDIYGVVSCPVKLGKGRTGHYKYKQAHSATYIGQADSQYITVTEKSHQCFMDVLLHETAHHISLDLNGPGISMHGVEFQLILKELAKYWNKKNPAYCYDFKKEYKSVQGANQLISFDDMLQDTKPLVDLTEFLS